MEKLIEVLKEMNPAYTNGCVILHFDKETGELKSISPMLPVQSIDGLYQGLSSAEKAIHQFLEDLINKGLYKKGQQN